MKKTFIFILIVALLILISWLTLPFLVDKEVSEASPLDQDTSISIDGKSSYQLVASGNFSGFDRFHYGSGTASLIKSKEQYIIRFEEDFDVSNGPDLYVGLGKDGNYIEGSEILRLKGNKGSQNYLLPEDFDINKTNEVWIWCKAFSVPFAKAVLN